MNEIIKNTHSVDDISKIKQLAEVLTSYNLSAVEILEDDKKYRVEKEILQTVNDVVTVNTEKAAPAKKEELYTITSPMVGVFYDTVSMDKGALVRVGQQFKKGDTLCVLEAMKTFTEIHAKDDGEIKEICVKNGDIIEYSQPLFKYIKN